MNDDMTLCADVIARELARRDTDPNEVAKVATYLRTHLDGGRFFRLLETMVRDGRHLVRTGRTLDYYRDIQEVCQRHLGSYRTAKAVQAHEMAQILGWAIRLMRYYKGAGVPSSARPLPLPTAPSAPLPEVPQAVPSPGPKKPISKPAGVKTERELVTLVEEAKNGKARVQTTEGTQLICAGFPYIGADQGRRCRADVTRQDGKAVSAKFKGWG